MAKMIITLGMMNILPDSSYDAAPWGTSKVPWLSHDPSFQQLVQIPQEDGNLHHKTDQHVFHT